MKDSILVTGGAGFMGAHFVLSWISVVGKPVVNLDLLTYAGNKLNLDVLENDSRYSWVHGDICDRDLVSSLLRQHRPRAIVHFAAESHVDRSIVAPEAFVRTNVEGTLTLLDVANRYWSDLCEPEKSAFRFLHVSTDEVYGSLGPQDPPFTEQSAYAPNSPYAASKAAADHLVRAYYHTWGLPVLTTNCSNNYGPMQSPEKLIPLMILNASEGRALPVYGDGRHVRDWLFVDDHSAAIRVVLEGGRPGESYNIGGNCERTNLEVVSGICDLVDELRPDAGIGPRRQLIEFVRDRPGHDRRYAVDATKIARELSWRPTVTFNEGLRRTVCWYLDHPAWVESARNNAYRKWMEQNYGGRLTE